MSKLKIGSLFAGIGGIDLAFAQAGFEIVWANEIDNIINCVLNKWMVLKPKR